jgi:hypothetical protein
LGLLYLPLRYGIRGNVVQAWGSILHYIHY